MLEKRNMTEEKAAAGDAGVFDDIVDTAVDRMGRARKPGTSGPRGREKALAREAAGRASETAAC